MIHWKYRAPPKAWFLVGVPSRLLTFVFPALALAAEAMWPMQMAGTFLYHPFAQREKRRILDPCFHDKNTDKKNKSAFL